MKHFYYTVLIKGMTLNDELPRLKDVFQNSSFTSQNLNIISVIREDPISIVETNSHREMSVQDFIETFSPDYIGSEESDDSYRYECVVSGDYPEGGQSYLEVEKDIRLNTPLIFTNPTHKDILKRAEELRDIADAKVLRKAIEGFIQHLNQK